MNPFRRETAVLDDLTDYEAADRDADARTACAVHANRAQGDMTEREAI